MTDRIAVICHDVEGNALGRAMVLAELLRPVAEVRIVGFGGRVWGPGADVPVTLIPRPPTNAHLPAAARQLGRAVHDATILVASKTRVLSYGLTAAIRGGRPHILDVDDLEHVFVRRRFGWLRQLVEPDREPLTRVLERIPASVSGVTVASRALQHRYGGTWIPHVRDRTVYHRQAEAEGPRVRRSLGLEDRFVVGFVGTPRTHKGLQVAAKAIVGTDPAVRLLVAGNEPEDPEMRRIQEIAGGRVLALGIVPMTAIPGLLGACDIVLIPQLPSAASVYQSPAKLFDAMAAGSAIIASDIGDALEVLGSAGIFAAPGDPVSLARAILTLRSDPGRRSQLRRESAARYSSEFGIERWRRTMEGVIADATAMELAKR